MEKILISLLCLLGGLFAIFCSAKNYDWFMEHRKARTMSAILGRNGARAFYIVLGAVMALAGLAILLHPNIR